MERGIRRILRSPSLKRKTKVLPPSERCSLERVLGLTVSNTSSLALDHHSGTVAYPAGCVIVLYNHVKKKQQFIINKAKKAFTCVAFSRDGKHLVTGETGHLPAVRVWEIDSLSQVSEFVGHKFGINCVDFSPNNKFIISIGSQFDMIINVYNWRSNLKVASNKVANKVTSVCFSEDGNTFVTVGTRHVKFWDLDSSCKSRINQTVPLNGRNAILGDQKCQIFCAVAFGQRSGRGEKGSSVYAVTASGLLCEFNESRLLSKWVELRTTCAFSLAVSPDFIFIGCADGTIRVFDAKSLHFVSTLPKPHSLGVDVAAVNSLSDVKSTSGQYADCIALRYDAKTQRLVAVYNDHSLYLWDVKDPKRVGKTRSFLFHSGCVWAVQTYPSDIEGRRLLPPGSFITASGDDTIRIWNLDPHMDSSTTYRRNLFSHELLKVLYADPELTNLQDKEYNIGGKTDKTDTNFQDKNGIRVIEISPDGKQLASGDRVGNIRIHRFDTMEQVKFLEAHDSEILCLEFCKPQLGVRLLASASRDRMLHILDVDQDFGLVQTLDGHSAAITSVHFIQETGNDGEEQLHLVSCGADKSLLFSTAQQDPDFQFVLGRHLVSKTTLYDMCVDPTGKYVATACQDRNVRIYNLKNGKQKKCYNGSIASDGVLLRAELDPSGSYVATSCDKCVSIYNFFTGECVASMLGHSEVITALKFTNDLKHIITVAGDSCIFIWRLPTEMTEQMKKRLMELEMKQNNNFFKAAEAHQFQEETANQTSMDSAERAYRFSVGQLPSWAKKQLQDPAAPSAEPQPPQPDVGLRGRWGQQRDAPVIASPGGVNKWSAGMSSVDGVLQQLQPQVIDDDDELNKDEDDEDEFSVMVKNATFAIQEDERLSLLPEDESRRSLMRSNSMDMSEDPEDVIFYAEQENGADPSINTFKVFEGQCMSFAENGSDNAEEDSDNDSSNQSALTLGSPIKTPDGDKYFQFGSFEPKEIEEDRAMTHRLSFSSRFLSRDQANILRSMASDANQLKKSEMSKTVSETRKKLQALGWRSASIRPSQHASLHSVPEKNENPDARYSHLSSSTTLSIHPAFQEGVNIDQPAPHSTNSLTRNFTVERKKWDNIDLHKSASPPRKWKSMVDVGRPQEATKGRPLTPSQRSVTPTTPTSPRHPFHLNRRQSSPDPLRLDKCVCRSLSSTKASSPAGASPASALCKCRRPNSARQRPAAPSSSPCHSPKTSLRSRPSSASGTAAQRPSAAARDFQPPAKLGDKDKRRSLPTGAKNVPSYMQGTKSSSSKTKDEAPVKGKSRAAKLKGRLSSSFKSKFKSTPNLAAEEPKEGEPDLATDDILLMRRASSIKANDDEFTAMPTADVGEPGDELMDIMPPPPTSVVPKSLTVGKKEITLTEAKSILLTKMAANEEKKTVTINLAANQESKKPAFNDSSPQDLPIMDHAFVSTRRGSYDAGSETFVIERGNGEPDVGSGSFDSPGVNRMGRSISPISAFTPPTVTSTPRRSLPQEPTELRKLAVFPTSKSSPEAPPRRVNRWGTNSPVCLPMTEERSASPITIQSSEGVERLQQKAKELHQQWKMREEQAAEPPPVPTNPPPASPPPSPPQPTMATVDKPSAPSPEVAKVTTASASTSTNDADCRFVAASLNHTFDTLLSKYENGIDSAEKEQLEECMRQLIAKALESMGTGILIPNDSSSKQRAAWLLMQKITEKMVDLADESES